MKRTLIKAAVATVLVGLSILSALALNVDQTKTPVQRQFGYQMVHYYRWSLNWNDPGVGTAQKFAVLGQNALITKIACYVTTAFNGTPTLSLGTNTTATNLLAASGGGGASIDLTSATYQDATAAAGLGQKITSTGDVTLYSKFSATGGTTGVASCVLQYAPNNDM